GPGEDAPLIVSGQRLFLHRYYHLEKEVAALITQRNQQRDFDAEFLSKQLDKLFGGAPSEQVDLQRLAVFQACSRNLAIVTGGPGTGKTSIVAKVIDLLLAENPDTRVRLAAPTGKAAMRLMESLGDGRDGGGGEKRLDDDLEVFTLHRLLGMRRDGRSFRHSEDNPIPLDVLIIDEASMVDLALMHRTLSALPSEARLILLGDPYQLPSVETGNVLGDLCTAEPAFSADFCKAAAPFLGQSARFVGQLAPTEAGNLLTDAICRLEVSHRFADDSAIGLFAAAIKRGDAELGSQTSNDFIEVHDAAELDQDTCAEQLLDHWQDYLALMTQQDAGAKALLNAFEQCRILCSRRNGFPGATAINEAIEELLENRRLKDRGSPYFQGRPILVTRNDYNLRLFNGDIGICVRKDNVWQVGFPSADGELRFFLATRLPVHETCYAMTVHKSQGSEFDRVILMLTEESGGEADDLLTRELVYTGLTRSRQFVTLYCNPDDWQAIMQRTAQRTSGMTDFLSS
ncbi:MAG: exodeoxyribonuclease V subunit alpha, partial [Pseudomonadales bacterium]